MKTSNALVSILFYFCIFLFTAPFASADELRDLRIENELLESELVLAKKAMVYFIFNLKEKKVYLKTRGATRQEMPIERAKVWNLNATPKTQALLNRSSLFKPKRDQINPNENEDDSSGTFEINALELEDMPSRFKLVLEDGLVIKVRPASRGIMSYPERFWSSLTWHISSPLFTVWQSLGKSPYSSLIIYLDKKDAKSLYWSFHEGTRCIIYNP